MTIRLRNLALLLVLLTSGCYVGEKQDTQNAPFFIAQIQGCAHVSPFDGQNVSDVRGVVTAKNHNGFYMQSTTPDELDCSSEGIFVFTDVFPDVVPGDEVSVSGRVEEFMPGQVKDQNLTLTEIVEPEVKILSTHNLLPAYVVIGSSDRKVPDKIIDNDGFRIFDPDEDGIDFFESLESMLVSIEGGAVVGPRNTYNEVVIIPQEYRSLNHISESGALLQTENDANPERLILNLNKENKQQVNIGAALQGRAVGVLEYAYGNYKVETFGLVAFSENNPVIPRVNTQQNSLTLATYNVKNLSLQGEARRFRGIASHIIHHLSAPDIVVLHEVLDNSGEVDDGVVSATDTIKRLIDEIARKGGPTYSFLAVDPENNADGGIPGGNIRSVILYQTGSGLTPVEEPEYEEITQNPMVIGDSQWPFNATRKPLIALFDYKERRLMLVAVHLTSRSLDSALFGRAQPIERLEEEKRIEQARYIEQFLYDFHRNHPEIQLLLAGDVNDNTWSKTMTVLTSRILFDAGNTIADNERFSFIYDGNAIQLDHILVSDPKFITQYTIPHLNSLLDYSLQMSDHDPVLVELDFGERTSQ